MLVTVHLHTILQKQTDQGLLDRLQIHLPEGTRLAELLVELDIELSPESLLLAVNGRIAEPGQVLEDGDQVNLMPAISGGSADFRLTRWGHGGQDCWDTESLYAVCRRFTSWKETKKCERWY